MAENNNYEGFVDTYEGGLIIGWARSISDDNPLKVIARIGNRMLGSTIARNYRPDLKDAGKGNGYAGFNFELSQSALQYADESELEIEIVAKGESELLLSRFLFKRNQLSKIQKENIYTEFEEFDFSFLNKSTKFLSEKDLPVDLFKYREYKKKQNKVINKLFEIANDKATACDNYKYQPKPRISKYLDFTRKRFRVDGVFKTDYLAEDIDNYLLWYIESYGAHRNPIRIPFSSVELDYLNELVVFPGCKYKFSRLHVLYLFKYQPALDIQKILNNIDDFKQEVYKFCLYTACTLNVQDCLLPDSYRTLMGSVGHSQRTNNYPLTAMAELYFRENQELNYFDLNSEVNRKAFYALLLVRSTKLLPLIFAIPSSVILEFISKDHKFNFIEELYSFCTSETINTINFSSGHILSTFLQKGLNLSTKSFLTIDDKGNRTEGNVYESPLESDIFEYDVQLIGPVNKASGLGQATRLSADILAATGLDVNIVDFGLDNPAKEGFNAQKTESTLAKAKINLIHLNAESIPLLFAYYPDYFSNSYNIGYFYWELDSPADCHALGMELVDEIWVSTDYGVDQYSGYVDKPVVNVGMAYEEIKDVDNQLGKTLLEEKYGIPQSSTVFLFAFDSFSFPERKNPLGTITAFQNAFPDDEEAILLIKTHNRDFIVDKKQIEIWEEINHKVSMDSRIRIVDETFKYSDLIKFKSGCDCYVSLHRSEGWGFGMIEAMGLGLAVIATNYSGNLEFCSSENSWLIDFELKYVDKEDYVFVKAGQQWAEPSIVSASNAMREAYYNSEKRKDIAQKGKSTALKDFSVRSISTRYLNRLNEILNG